MLCYKFNNQYIIIGLFKDLFANLKYKNRFDFSKRFLLNLFRIAPFYFFESIFLTVSNIIGDAINNEE